MFNDEQSNEQIINMVSAWQGGFCVHKKYIINLRSHWEASLNMQRHGYTNLKVKWCKQSK